ncbi:MAG: hypothetical protein PHG27_00100 [Massilibacteroides sp.]|nr:hypothetical protein [Massilibacteroides sp.]MDD3062273.1 hypothetical protein [Massilibacteroides sp.]MDD4113988.1 hypothetical protein [Massilibacteroides sp.]MDD4660046.1 hypothetical protein [Massilibacteroides sp.]
MITNFFKKKVQRVIDRIDVLLYHNRVVIGNRSYRWCKIPIPEGYPRQSQTHPSIFYTQEKWNHYTHWLATTPYPNSDTKFENPCIYKANQQNDIIPICYSPISNNPIVCHPGGDAYNSDPELFIINNTLYCIIRENENKHYLREIKLSSSTDGEIWTKPKTIYYSNDEKRQLLSPAYLKTKNKHQIYFLNGDAGIGRHGKCSGIEIIESENLETLSFKFVNKGNFTNSKEVGIEPWHFDLFEYKNCLYMVLCGRNKKRKTIRNPMETFLAVSTDRINFHIFEKPLIRYFKTYRPSAYIDEAGIFHLYFSTIGFYLNDNSDRNIGVTSIPFKQLLNELKDK